MRLSLLSKLEAHEDGVWSVSWVPGGSELLLTGSVDESVKLWEDVADQPLNTVHTYTGHTLGVVSVVVDPTGTYAASSALDSFLRVWNLRDHSVKAVIENNPTETWGIAFSPDTSKLRLAVASGTAQRVLIYNIEDDDQHCTNLDLPKQVRDPPTRTPTHVK
jgi:WD repeat-containing protein 61